MQSPNTYNPSRRSRNKLWSVVTSTKSEELVSAPPRGFTLIEIIVVMAIFTVALGLGLFMTMDAYRGFSFRSEQDAVVSVLQKARSRAINNMNQSPWGVCYITPNYVIFAGSTCTATNSDLIPANPGVATASRFATTFPIVVFSQLAATSTGGTITVTQNARTSTVQINYEGTIIW